MTVVRLHDILATDLAGNGVHRTLTDGAGDLNVNVVHLDAGSEIADHVTSEVDVLMIVLEGNGLLRIDETDHALVASALAYIASGRQRSIVAGPEGLTYLTAHRARGSLRVS
jgi:quercetin dioxygenase-like cupin family protein